ncbi:MAG: hypothetical protein DCC66_02945 [Planctomycetota bacterium]|nr:MAG: hypothetical protein DCC66_02945 [Planctomycetota bacterium]
MQHHFLPQHYLRGFTVLGTEDGELYRFDRLRGVFKKTIPRKCARVGGLYAARLPDAVGSNLLENMLAQMESTVAPVLRNTLSICQLPSGVDRLQLLVYVAALCARDPEVRNNFTPSCDFRERSIACTSSAADFARLVSPLVLCGVNVSEQHRQAFYSLALQIPASSSNRDAEWPLWMLLGTNLIYHEYMIRRGINVLVCNDDASDLVCSDNPARFWFDTSGGTTVPGEHDLNLCLALGRRMGLLITKNTRGQSQSLTPNQVVGFNGYAVRQAARFVFSSSPSYEIEIEHGGKQTIEDYALSIRRAV